MIANNQNNIKIIGNGIPDSGITSAYTPHQFYLDGVGTEQIINARWCFYIPTIDGNESLQKSTNGTLSFSIDEISFPGNYAVNVKCKWRYLWKNNIYRIAEWHQDMFAI